MLLASLVAIKFFKNTMAVNSELERVLQAIGLASTKITDVAAIFPTLQDIFGECAIDRPGLETQLRFLLPATVLSHNNLCRVMDIFDWFLANVSPSFDWTTFTRTVYVNDKRTRTANKANLAAPVVPSALATGTADFSADVLKEDAQRAPVIPGTTSTLKPHALWVSPFASATHSSKNSRQFHTTELVLASSDPTDVIEFYRRLVAAAKPAEVDLIPLGSFDPKCALWPSNCCAEVICEMNDALALRLDQTGTLNRSDETIKILHQKYILDSNSGVRTYDFLHALLKKAKKELNKRMPTPPDIASAPSIGMFGANLERYYLEMTTINVQFQDKTKSRFFLTELQQQGVDIDQYLDRLDNVPSGTALPDELTLAELILKIKDIRKLPANAATIHRIATHHASTATPSTMATASRSHNSDHHSRPQPVREFRIRTDAQCICGRWGHTVQNCQQLAVHYNIHQWLNADPTNTATATTIVARWCTANAQFSRDSRSAQSTVRAIRAILPATDDHTDEDILECLYKENDDLSD
jgi:hypothetical protein